MVCGADGSIKLWSVETGTSTNLILSDYGLDLTCIDLSSNRQWLAQGTTNQGLQIVQLPSDSTIEMPSRTDQEPTFSGFGNVVSRNSIGNQQIDCNQFASNSIGDR